MSWRDKDFVYRNANETAKPGYLKRRFTAIRREAREAEERRRQVEAETATVVRQIKAAGGRST